MSIPFRRIKEILNAKAYKEFNEFMSGQTVDAEGVFEDGFLRSVLKQEVVD